MSLLLGDVVYVVFCSVCIIASSLLNHLLRKTIRDKPAGSKTVGSEIHVSTSYAHQALIFTGGAPLIFRSIFGPTVPGGVILIIEYSRFASGLLTILTLGYGALVKFGFLVSYGRMSEVPDKVVKRASYCWCVGWIGIAIGSVVIRRWRNGTPFSVNIPLLNGRQALEDSHPQFDIFFVSSLGFTTLTQVLLFIAKIRRFVLIFLVSNDEG